MSLVVFLDLCIDATLPGGLVQLPLGHLEEVCSLPEAHLSGADHVNGVLKCFILGQFAAVNRYPLILESWFGNTYNIENMKGLLVDNSFYLKQQKGFSNKTIKSFIELNQMKLARNA